MPRQTAFDSLRASAIAEEEARLRAADAADDANLAKGKKHAVHEAWLHLLHIMLFCAGVLIFVAMLHLIMPPYCRWLPDYEIQQLITGIIGSLVGYMAHSVQKYL